MRCCIVSTDGLEPDAGCCCTQVVTTPEYIPYSRPPGRRLDAVHLELDWWRTCDASACDASACNRSTLLHPHGAVEPDRLAVEVRVGQDRLHHARKLVGLAWAQVLAR